MGPISLSSHIDVQTHCGTDLHQILGLAAIKWFLAAFETLNLLTYLLTYLDSAGLASPMSMGIRYTGGISYYAHHG